MRILLVQRRSLGDALYSLLVAEIIKRDIPQAKVDFLTLPFAVNFFNLYKFVDSVIPDRGLLKNLNSIAGKYDAVIDYEATFRTYPLVFFSFAKKRIAFFRKPKERFLYPIYNHLIRYKSHNFTFWDRLILLEPFGIDYKRYIKERFLPSFPFKEEVRPIDYKTLYGNYIVLTPKGVIPTKEIKPQKVKEIYETLQQKLGLNVVIAVEPKEGEYINQLKKLGLEVFSEDLVHFAFLLKGAKALVSIESFPYHLALLFRVPSVVIVQGYDIWFKERFGLIEEYKPPLECVPCWKRDRCLRGDFACTEYIEINTLLGKLKKFLKT